MTEQRSRFTDIAVFCLLVAIGVVGRWGQPDWCVTPMAAIGLMAGRYFHRAAVALLVPLVAMGISDLVLPSYDRAAVFLAVYAAMVMAVVWGRLLRRPVVTRFGSLARLACCAAAPAVGFFLLTNFAVWASSSLYAKTPAGLLECYSAALPFFRRMLAGDLIYTAMLFGLAAAFGAISITGTRKAITTDGA